MAPLSDKVAIITGGSKGIGKATALRLARDGANVVIQYKSDQSGAQEVVDAIGPSIAFAVKGNAANVADTDELIRRTVEKFKHIDIIVANAGSLPHKDLMDTSEQDFQDCVDLNVKGPYFLVQVWHFHFPEKEKDRIEGMANSEIQKAAPYLRSGARIILVSSTLCHASTVTPRYLLYLSTKGAIEQMVRVLSKDFGPRGITVNAVAPGPTDTELFKSGANESVLAALKSSIPSGRLGTPEEIAETMAFLSSPGSGWVSGQVVRVNGGMA